MEKRTAIDVCIATFKRPALLSELLASLQEQDLAGIAMRIIVIDNDRTQSARATVEAFSKRNLFDIVYDVEPQQNIALARNRALTHVTSDYFAFIDDDESVSSRWLRSLLDSMIAYKADIVFGPVICTLPVDAPAWAGRCFGRPRRPTGAAMQFGGAGNVLLKRSTTAHPGTHFDPAFGLTGGEDTEYFYRQFLLKRRLIWCDEATATEAVPPARLTLKWIRRRGFRSGQNYHRIFVSRYSSYRKLSWFVQKLMQLAGGIAVAPFVRLVSHSSYVALTVRIAAASGQLSCCFSGENFEEYNIRRYQ
jgi:succinoglycan biosynthesis protein ExoM